VISNCDFFATVNALYMNSLGIFEIKSEGERAMNSAKTARHMTLRFQQAVG